MDPSADLLFEIPRGLEQSILLAALIGFVVTLVLVETFGWVFVGVIVPGYLASILVIQPPAGVAVVLDATLTYLVAKALERLLGRVRASSAFFGRERFFLIVLVSVFVRQHTQSWLWPLTLEQLEPWWGLPVGFQRSFSSIGIVLVPLMANVMWKLDVRRGLLQLTVTTLVTYAALAWWLLPETTLSYSALELSYEDTAIDFLGNAKAYIIFLCTAFVAAQLNLRYGWDFNGILVPALLGMLWFHPDKLAATFGEAIVVYLVTIRLPRAPGLRRINIEGPRRLALVFITSVALKWTLGWALGDHFPTLKITDLYGFGYLLPALLVIKMMQRKSMRAVLLPTAVASLLGFVLGSLVGFVLSFADPPPPPVDARARPVGARGSSRLLADPRGVGAFAHLHALERIDDVPNRARRAAYAELWEAVVPWLDEPSPESREAVDAALAHTDLELVPSGTLGSDTAYALVERSDGPRRGWDTALLLPGAPGPALVVPRPVAEAPLAEAATELCLDLRCRALVVAGHDVERAMLTSLGGAPHSLVRDALEDVPTLILRADDQTGPTPVLHVGDELPPSLDLNDLWGSEIELSWADPPVAEPGPLPERGGTLRLNARFVEDRLDARATAVRAAAELPPWVARRIRSSSPDRLPSSTPPSAREARYLEQMLVTPLVELASGRSKTEIELDRLAWRAARLGLELHSVHDCKDGRPCLALVDPLGEEGLGWGALLLRWGDARELGVEVPRPGRAFGTHQLGLELWQQTDARALYIGPDPGRDGQDPLAVGNIHSPLLPFHQALDRALGDGSTPPLVIQVLGFGVDRMLDAPLVIGLGRPVLSTGQLPLKLRWLLEQGPLRWADRYVLSDGSPSLHALSGHGTPPMEYSLGIGRANVATLWFSPEVRSRFVSRGHREEEARAMALGLRYGEITELEALAPSTTERATKRPPAAATELLDELLGLTLAYRRSHDIHGLRRLVSRAEAETSDELTVRIEVGRGTLTELPVASIELVGPRWSLRSLALLEAAVDRRETRSADDPKLRAELREALTRRAATIVVESGSGGPRGP